MITPRDGDRLRRQGIHRDEKEKRCEDEFHLSSPLLARYRES